ncbi:MAG: glycosyltransferase, partial [Casimicrobiaceae bacterium]
DVPRGVPVVRAFALDAARHLSVAGRYPGFLARPDRWLTWKYAAIRAGMRMIRSWRPDVIWSTFPIATAHLIASALHRRAGLPWIADFRDPMAQDGYPADPKIWASYQRIESTTVRTAARSVFTSPGAVREYTLRYPECGDRLALIENGYDEESFAGIDTSFPRPRAAPGGAPVVLLHSGIVYPSERDPTQLFEALGRLRTAGQLPPGSIEFRFRASANDDLLRTIADRHGVADLVSVLPAIPYRDALAEMAGVDALLVMQASNCNAQIPAKVYEYLRAGRPIYALTDPAGDTAGLMRRAGVADVAPLDSADAIAASLPSFVTRIRAATAVAPSREFASRCTRKERTRALAELLDGASAD